MTDCIRTLPDKGVSPSLCCVDRNMGKVLSMPLSTLLVSHGQRVFNRRSHIVDVPGIHQDCAGAERLGRTSKFGQDEDA